MKPPPFSERDPKRQLAELMRPQSRGGSVRSSGGGRVVLSLSIPSRAVSKNCRNWAVKAKATKAARDEACQAALIARVQGDILRKWWGATATVKFFVATKHKRDPMNLMDRCHPFWDGIEDAGLVTDDCHILAAPAGEPQVSSEPRVEIELWERDKP